MYTFLGVTSVERIENNRGYRRRLGASRVREIGVLLPLWNVLRFVFFVCVCLSVDLLVFFKS